MLLFFVIPFSYGQATWTADPAHSSIGFEVSHLTISTVSGKFTDYSCDLVSKRKSFDEAQINVKVNVGSISTEDLTRDKHLKEDDFFNAESYPNMIFVSDSFVKTSDTEYQVTGFLTIRNVVKKISFVATNSGTVTIGDKTISAFKAEFIVNRFDYQLKWDDTLDSGGLVVGEDVTVILNIELVKS